VRVCDCVCVCVCVCVCERLFLSLQLERTEKDRHHRPYLSNVDDERDKGLAVCV
jgi:hypothetical protein